MLVAIACTAIKQMSVWCYIKITFDNRVNIFIVLLKTPTEFLFLAMFSEIKQDCD